MSFECSNMTTTNEGTFSDSNVVNASIDPSPTALHILSDTLESIFTDTSSDFNYFSDSKFVLCSGKEIALHRCILSARSQFFRSLFSNKKGKVVEAKEILNEYEVGYEALVTVLGYLYSGKVKLPVNEAVICVDDEHCDHLGCRPAVSFLLQLLYVSFVFQLQDLLLRFQSNLMDVLDKVTADDILMVLSVSNICGSTCEGLLASCIDIIVKSDVDIITLDKALPHHLVKQINELRIELGLQSPESSCFPDKHVKRIYRALDSDDVELVRMLLKEEGTGLDDAYALHYAVAYCDAKTTTELLDLAIADINHRNLRGYTVLHVAAMRTEPNIVVSLLTKGARPSDLTLDGRNALQISKRLTRAVDYNRGTEEGKATPKERLCIEILEQAERRDPLLGEASVSLAIAGDDLRKKLLYLEHRVALAKLLFPVEAKVAMDIAQVDGTSEFELNGVYKSMAAAQRTAVDLNEAPFKIKEEHLNRLRALSKTVELGKRFFPRCSAVINKIMDGDECPDVAELGMDSVEDESPCKRQRRLELEEDFKKAFTEDKEEFNRTFTFSSSASSSSSVGMMKPNGKYTFRK